MFCPKCGQRQAAGQVRFCSSCGLPLDGVSVVLANHGQLPARAPEAGPRPLTARQKGVRQGAMLMLSTLLLVPLVAIVSAIITGRPELFVPVTAIICFVGGLLRIFYALLLEGGAEAAPVAPTAQTYVPPAMPPNYLGTPERSTALPPPQSIPVPAQRPPRFETGEMPLPPKASVTDHTTRLLERQPEEPPEQ